jgi:hypothetical protein
MKLFIKVMYPFHVIYEHGPNNNTLRLILKFAFLRFRNYPSLRLLLWSVESILHTPFTLGYFDCFSSLVTKFDHVRFQIFTAVSLKMTAFWATQPCSLVEVDRRFGGVYCLHHQGNGGSTHLWDIGVLQRDYRALYIRRLSFLCTALARSYLWFTKKVLLQASSWWNHL